MGGDWGLHTLFHFPHNNLIVTVYTFPNWMPNARPRSDTVYLGPKLQQGNISPGPLLQLALFSSVLLIVTPTLPSRTSEVSLSLGVNRSVYGCVHRTGSLSASCTECYSLPFRKSCIFKKRLLEKKRIRTEAKQRSQHHSRSLMACFSLALISMPVFFYIFA